ncbi:MAG: flagellar hook-associated family protein [Anderseniella sp.]
MELSHVSTSALYNNVKLTLQRSQVELAQRQTEVTTGRHADVNLALGPRSGGSITLRAEQDRLEGILNSNTLVATRLDLIQSSVAAVTSSAQSVVSSLTTALGSQATVGIAIEQTVTQFQNITTIINSSANGQYLFAGVNTDVKPLADFVGDPAGTAQTAVNNAFTTEFGFAPDDPAVSTITPAAMEAFIDGAFSAIFEDDVQWSAAWSSAEDKNISSRIGPNLKVETGINANETGIRSISAALTMVSGLGGEGLNAETLAVVFENALSKVAEGMASLNDASGRLGLVQQQISEQNDVMTIRKRISESYVAALEGVDAFEAASRVNQLTAQIETSYSLTARLQSLSLLNYV